MRHVPDGALRRHIDEPFAVSDAQIHHLESCDRCRVRRLRIAENATLAGRLMVAPDAAVEAGQAWASLRRSSDGPNRPGAALTKLPRYRARRLMGASLSTGTTAAAVGLLVAGVAAAATLTTVFAPTKVAPLPVSLTDLTTLSNLAGVGPGSVLGGFNGSSGSRSLRFGTLRWSSAGGGRSVTSLQAAEAASGLTVVLPRSRPAGVGAPSSFEVQPAVTATITWSAAAGSALEGSSLSVRLGPAVLVRYGGSPVIAGLPTLAILAMERPIATSTGATTAELEHFILSQPGVPGDLAQAIRLIGNLTTTLPVPTPKGAVESPAVIGGSPAVTLTAASGAASGVIWEDHTGLVHVVAGLLDRQDVLGVANQVG